MVVAMAVDRLNRTGQLMRRRQIQIPLPNTLHSVYALLLPSPRPAAVFAVFAVFAACFFVPAYETKNGEVGYARLVIKRALRRESGKKPKRETKEKKNIPTSLIFFPTSRFPCPWLACRQGSCVSHLYSSASACLAGFSFRRVKGRG